MGKAYRLDLDLMKAIAIIGVVFYHIGWLDTGYLGVDVFFVINGFFILPSLLEKFDKSGETFNIKNYLIYRIMRFWPLIIISSLICLGIGYVSMLPDDFENLSQSVIASDLFSQNILSAITTKNYWDVVNEYKPLMHFWYVGILVEFYIFIVILIKLIHWCSVKMNLTHKFKTYSILIIKFLLIVSFLLYILPITNLTEKFYYLPCRLYELLAGGLVGIYCSNSSNKKIVPFSSFIIIVFIVFIICGSMYMPQIIESINPVSAAETITMLIPQNVLLITIVLLTCLLLISKQMHYNNLFVKSLAYIGKISFSIFVWHQILLAFYRYIIDDDMSIAFVCALLVTTFLISFVTYSIIEQKIKPTKNNFIICGLCVLLTIVPAFLIYLNAGVIRDVPELNVKKGDVHTGMFADYCDRIYKYDRDFENNGKIKVLVEGVSFGRDFANVLLESDYADLIDLSYVFKHDERYLKRYQDCDFLFTFSNKKDVPDYVWNSIRAKTKVYGIGTKNFGSSNGIVYQKRNTTDYFQQEVMINSNFYIINKQWKNEWGGDYIDFLSLSKGKHGGIRVFTDNNKFISQDCRHLTKDGAIWFAKIIDLKNIFN